MPPTTPPPVRRPRPDPHAPPRRHGALADAGRLHAGLRRRRSRVRPRTGGHRQDLSGRRLRRAMPGARARSSASCCRVRRWKRASGWASCPATCARRSIPICARSTTRSTIVLPPAKVERDLATGVIEIAPLAFMRGRTLAHSFVILDEAQNTTSMQMKMFLTRIGEGSKMVVTGDPSQIDLPLGPAVGPGGGRRAADGRRGHRGGPLHLRRRGAPRSRGPHRRRLRQSRSRTRCSHERPGRQYALHSATPSAGPEPEPPDGLTVAIVEEDGDWSGFGRLSRRSARPPRRWLAIAQAARGAAAARPASCWQTMRWCAA